MPCLRNVCLPQSHEGYCLRFPSRMFIVILSTYVSVNLSQINFCILCKVRFSMFSNGFQFDKEPLIEYQPFPSELQWCPCHKSGTIHVGFISGYSIHFDLCILCQNHSDFRVVVKLVLIFGNVFPPCHCSCMHSRFSWVFWIFCFFI